MVMCLRPAHGMCGTFLGGEFRLGRFQGDYADVGTEVQIEHYKIADGAGEAAAATAAAATAAAARDRE